MPTKEHPPKPTRQADPDPPRPVDYGGDAVQDDADVPNEGGKKGGHPLDPEEKKRGIRHTSRD